MDNMSLSDIAAVTRGNDNDGCGHCGCTDQSGIDFPGAQCVRLRKLYPELPADRYCCRGEQYGCGRGKTVRGRTWL